MGVSTIPARFWATHLNVPLNVLLTFLRVSHVSLSRVLPIWTPSLYHVTLTGEYPRTTLHRQVTLSPSFTVIGLGHTVTAGFTGVK